MTTHPDLEGSHTRQSAIDPEMKTLEIRLGIAPGKPEDLQEFLCDRPAFPEQRTGAEGQRAQRRLDAPHSEFFSGARHLPGAVGKAPGPLGDFPELEVRGLRRRVDEHQIQKQRIALVERESEFHIAAGELVDRPWGGIHPGRWRGAAGGPENGSHQGELRKTEKNAEGADSGSVCGERWRCRRRASG